MTKALIDEVLSLPLQERRDLMDRIWESLAANPESISVPQEHRDILEARLAAYRAEPANIVTWEAVRRRYLIPQ